MTEKLTRKEIKSICSQISDDQIENVKNYVIFLGHAHSGHSLIGALLDAHKDVAIANELNIPKLILDHQLSVNEILKITLHYSCLQSRWEGQLNTGYKYKVTNGFQGLSDCPVVLGDKKGGGSTRIFRNHPGVFDLMRKALGDQLKIIHVIRDPLDNIASLAHYWGDELGPQHVERYFENMETVMEIKSLYPDLFFTMSHSAFISEPKNHLTRLFKFVGVDAPDDFLTSCLGLVKPKENRRSKQVEWPDNLLQMINLKKIELNLTDF